MPASDHSPGSLSTVRSLSLLAAGATLALLLAPRGEAAETIQQVVGDFGLLGNWAPDCSKPASPRTPRVLYAATADGGVQRELVEGSAPGGTGTPFTAASRVAPDRLELDYLYQDRTVHLVLEMQDGKQRGVRSWIDGGAPIVEDGVVLATNRRVPWLEKCRN
jgi:hypothetical protein